MHCLSICVTSNCMTYYQIKILPVFTETPLLELLVVIPCLVTGVAVFSVPVVRPMVLAAVVVTGEDLDVEVLTVPVVLVLLLNAVVALVPCIVVRTGVLPTVVGTCVV